MPVWRSRTKTSLASLVSPGTRLVASDAKATKRPSAEIAGPELSAIALDAARADADPLGRARLAVADEDVAHAVGVARHQVGGGRAEGDEAPVRRDRRADSCRPLPWAPPELTLTRRVVPVWRSRTNTSVPSLVSPGTRLVASDMKATKRPSAEIAGSIAVAIALGAA